MFRVMSHHKPQQCGMGAPGVPASMGFSFSPIHTAACTGVLGDMLGGGAVRQVSHKIANSVERMVQELLDVQVVWPLHTTEETTLRFSLWVLGEKVSCVHPAHTLYAPK